MDEDIQLERVSKLWELYENGLAYQRQIKLVENVRLQVDFYEGKQWKDSRKNIYFPKPIANIIKMIVRNKRSGVLSSPVSLEYESSEDSESAKVFTDFARYVAKELKQEDLDAVAILDGAVKGTYIYHFYWDNEARGLNSKVEGGLRGEIVDPTNVFFANPAEKDEQKQEWIIVSSRMPVKSAKALAERGVANPSLITADDAEDVYSEKVEQEDSDLCTVLTRYFRKNGEVYFEKAVQGTMLHAPRPLTPNVGNAEVENINNGQMDSAEVAAPDIEQQSNGQEPNKAIYYPITVGTWDERNGSIYGVSEVEGLIPNQKLINFLIALYFLLVQNAGMGKFLVLPGALEKQRITNEPGQVLVDYTNTGGGIRRMQEPGISSSALQLADKLMDITRSTTGSTEVMTGEQISSNMSGAAIAQLQQQANRPIEEMRKRFWRVQEKIGKIYEQFFKLFYESKEYTVESDDSQEKGVFDGSQYADTQFSCVVSAGAGTQYSEVMCISMLENLLSKNIIDAKTYIKLYPKTVNPNRNELLQAIDEQEQQQLQQLTQQLQQLQQQLQQMSQYITSKEKEIDMSDNVINENKRLKQMLLAMQDEATTKINQANQALTQQGEMIKILGGGIGGMPQMQVGTQSG